MTSKDPNMIKIRTRLTKEYNTKIEDLNKRTILQKQEYYNIRDKKVNEILDWNKNNVLRDIKRLRNLEISKLQ